jgi:hypothetical protein
MPIPREGGRKAVSCFWVTGTHYPLPITKNPRPFIGRGSSISLFVPRTINRYGYPTQYHYRTC